MRVTFIAILLLNSANVVFAEDKCSSVADCAQKAMEASYQAKLALQIALPKGAIIPFNLEKCPEGWKPFIAAQGRFIIGVNENYKFQTSGGRDDIPTDGAHRHPVQQSRGPNNGRFGNDNADDHWSTASAGSHNHGGINMPPFYALTYCERN